MGTLVLRVKRGATAALAALTGQAGTFAFDTEAKKLYIHDGVTIGGISVTGITEDAVDGKIATAVATKVDAVSGKGLSTNDFTDTFKTKLDGIADNATANQSDLYLLDRKNHSGAQAMDTVTGLQDALNAKVTVVSGKGLSTVDFGNADKSKLDGIAAGATVNSADATLLDRANHKGTQTMDTVTGLSDALGAKVDMVSGKGLSANDFTNTLKSKLDGISPGATVNSSDATLINRQNHTGSQGIDTITNLQTTLNSKVDVVSGKGLSTNDYTAADKAKVAAVGTMANRAVFISTAAPASTDGANGDLWLQYT